MLGVQRASAISVLNFDDFGIRKFHTTWYSFLETKIVSQEKPFLELARSGQHQTFSKIDLWLLHKLMIIINRWKQLICNILQ